jgi:hypothetical protein
MLSFSTEQHAIEGAIVFDCRLDMASPDRESPFSGKLLNASGGPLQNCRISGMRRCHARAAKYAHPGILGRRRLEMLGMVSGP